MSDWQPELGDTYPCACGCGELITYTGMGRPQKYLNDTHKKRAYRARDRVRQQAKETSFVDK